MPSLLRELNSEMATALSEAAQALVEVMGGTGRGAGVILHSSGLILTSAHVVNGRTPSVRLEDGRTMPAKVLAYDGRRDLAALSVETSGLPTIQLGDSNGLKPGQWVMALGHPRGVRGGAAAGVVASVEAVWDESSQLWRRWVMVELPLRPGHSGGPLVDATGMVVGINVMMKGPNLGIAVPSQLAKEFLKERLAALTAA